MPSSGNLFDRSHVTTGKEFPMTYAVTPEVHAPLPTCLACPCRHLTSPRQREILHFLMDGLNEKTIAGALQLSRNTVHHHVKHIYEAFAVNSRSELLGQIIAQVSEAFSCDQFARIIPADSANSDPIPAQSAH